MASPVDATNRCSATINHTRFGSQEPPLDENAMQNLVGLDGNPLEELVAEALVRQISIRTPDQDWFLELFDFLQRSFSRQTDSINEDLLGFLVEVFHLMAEVHQRPEYIRKILELVWDKEGFEWVSNYVICVVDEFMNLDCKLTDDSSQEVVFFLCDKGVTSEKGPERNKIFWNLSRLLLKLEAPEEAFRHILSMREIQYEKQGDALLTRFSQDLCRFCIGATVKSMERASNETMRGEAVHQLIEVLKCICLHCNKKAFVRVIIQSIVKDGSPFLEYANEFAQLMNLSEINKFFSCQSAEDPDAIDLQEPAEAAIAKILVLCKRGFQFELEMKNPKTCIEKNEMFTDASRLILGLSKPEKALLPVLLMAQGYGEDSDELLDSFFSALCYSCIAATEESIGAMIRERRAKCGVWTILEEERGILRPLIEVLKCVCLHCSDKSSVLQDIRDAIAQHDAPLPYFKEMFTEFMTPSEKNEFFSDYEKRKKNLELGSQTGEKLYQLVWKGEPDFGADS